ARPGPLRQRRRALRVVAGAADLQRDPVLPPADEAALFEALLGDPSLLQPLRAGRHLVERLVRRVLKRLERRRLVSAVRCHNPSDPRVAGAFRDCGRVSSDATGRMKGMSGRLAIRLRGAVKRYGPITAVDGFDLDVPYGTCVGLLGPNGAGKSTTMRLLTAQAIADEGELEVLGFRLPEESKQARALCGV